MTQSSVSQIFHDGIIKQVNEQTLFVSIISTATCASCQVKGACSASDMKEKIVVVKRTADREYQVGEKVEIAINQSVGTWAVLLGYVFPLIVVVVALIIFTNMMDNEGTAGLLSVGLLIPYYGILYLTRKMTADSFEFKLQ